MNQARPQGPALAALCGVSLSLGQQLVFAVGNSSRVGREGPGDTRDELGCFSPSSASSWTGENLPGLEPTGPSSGGDTGLWTLLLQLRVSCAPEGRLEQEQSLTRPGLSP